MRRRITVLTVGCKANFADSAAIAGEAAACGFDIVASGAPADVIVVNSCAVTRRAERDSRAAVRRTRRENPGATVVLTGCFAQVSAGARDRFPEVDHWIARGNGTALPALLRRISGFGGPSGTRPTQHTADLLLGHRRTFLKIQDGCDFRCAYCIVPRARGASRSVPEDEVVGWAVACEADGAREIVLTGIHIGAYGADRGERGGLGRLLARLLGTTSRVRFRLSSLEPLEIDDALIDLIAGTERVCPHLHVPLQSGSDAVLARMRRPYRARRYAAIVERATSLIEGLQ
ncbi:MAG: radical SAM protein, partial [Deltaproteobacteria bacterium]|nr:radical SAM protein [Deltaproteobacteria bacterium]